MHTRINEGANGRMSLYSNIKETGSGHIEEGKAIELQAKDESIIQLIEANWHNEYLHNNRDIENKNIYEIDVNDLIKLIKENGHRIK